MSKTCFRCQRPVPPGPVAFVPGPPGEGGWACPPRSRDACNLEAALRRHVEQLMAAEAASREAEVRAVLVFVSLATGVPVARIVADRIAELPAVDPDLDAAYAARMAEPLNLTPEDEDMLRSMLTRPRAVVAVDDSLDPPLDDPIEPDHWS